MKKILLCACAFIAFGTTDALAGKTKEAETPKPVFANNNAIDFTIGGYLRWYTSYVNQKKDTLTGKQSKGIFPLQPRSSYSGQLGNYDNVDLYNSGEIHFDGSYTFSNDVKIGFSVQMDVMKDDTSIDQTFITVDTKYGQFIIGNRSNVSKQMNVTAPDVSSIYLNDTDHFNAFQIPAGFAFNPANYSLLDNDNVKLSYITPEIEFKNDMNSVQAGISLMPAGRNARSSVYDESSSFKYGLDSVLRYKHDFGRMKMTVSANYTYYRQTYSVWGKDYQTPASIPNRLVQMPDDSNVHQYGAGVRFDIGNWAVGGSFHKVNAKPFASQAMMLLRGCVTDGYSWDAGISWIAGPVETSVNMFQSRADNLLNPALGKDVYSLYQASFKYKIVKGIDVFVDAGYVYMNSAEADPTASNKGPVIAVGTNLNF